MLDETYAVIEISKRDIKFVVGKYKHQIGLKVVFKDKERSKSSWLNESNEIIDVNTVYQKLSKMIFKYEHLFKEKIKAVSLIYPTSSLTIKNANSKIVINNPEMVITKEHIKSLYNEAKIYVFEDHLKITNIMPYEYIIDNQLKFNYPPIGSKAKVLFMNARVYAVEKKVINSFDEVVKKLKLDKLISINHIYSLAKQCNSQEFNKNFVLVNWDWNSIEIGFFAKRILVKTNILKIGVKDIIQNLANKMLCKFDIANKYIFRLLNLSSSVSDDVVLYKKYIENEKTIYKLTTKEIKNMLIEELYTIIDKADVLIANELMNTKNFNVYHCGKITEIAGFDKILLRSDFKNVTKLHYSIVTGASEIWTNSLCGMMKLLHEENKKFAEIKTSTNVYLNPIFANQNPMPVINQNNLNLKIPTLNVANNLQTLNNNRAINSNLLNQSAYHHQIINQQNYQMNQNLNKNGIINKQRNN